MHKFLKIETQNKEEHKLRKYRDLGYYPLERVEAVKEAEEKLGF